MRFSPTKVFTIGVILIIVVGGAIFLLKSKKEKIVIEPKAPEVIKEADLKYSVIGTSTEGRIIESFTYGNGENHLVFVGGIHGGYEWNSVLLAYEFIDYLDKNKEAVPENVKVTIIPSLNPDGVFRVTKKEGRFNIADASTDKKILASGRFNAKDVDLNRNFPCKWQPESKWQSRTVSAGSAPFSEPESLALKKFVEKYNPKAFVFWHSQSNSIYASECNKGILPGTSSIMDVYSKASGYPKADAFTSYVITGDSTDWLASINIPAITVELKTHETIEFEKNLLGFKAMLSYYKDK